MALHPLKNADFFQELFQLFKQFKPDSEFTRLSKKRLTLRASCALQFPVRDIDKIIESENDITIICRFMGLYGVDSPLPTYFNALCLKEDEEAQSLRAFLDIFNHRNYALYYQAWHAFHLNIDDYPSQSYQSVVRGISNHEKNGLMPSYGCSATLVSLKSYFKHFLPFTPITIDEQIHSWVSVESQALLGRDLVLNHNSLIGSRLYDGASKVQLSLGPINADEALQLMEEETLYDVLQWMRNVNIQFTIWFDLILKIKFENLSLAIGQTVAKLGQTTVLGLATNDEYRIKINAL